MTASIGQTNLGPSEAPSRTMTPPETLTIRRASMADARSIAQLAARVFEATFAHTCSESDMTDYLADNFTPEVVTTELGDNLKSFLVACLGETVVAFSCLTRGTNEECVENIPESERIELQRLYADLNVHGKGVAGTLMKKTMELAVDSGYKHVWLGVWEHNFRARKFYERFGFKMVGSHDFMLGAERQTDDIFLATL